MKTVFYSLVILIAFTAEAQRTLSPAEAAVKFLNLSRDSIYEYSSTSKKVPYLENTVIYAILEIKERGDGYVVFNMNVLLVQDNNKLLYQLREDHDINSDAVALSSVQIDTAPYFVREKSRAFGIRLSYSGSSRVNPYGSKTINFYEIKEGRLVNILNEFNMARGEGENNGADTGEWEDQESILVMSSKKTNDYYDITVKTRKHKRTYSADEDTESTTKFEMNGVLRFDSELGKYAFERYKE